MTNIGRKDAEWKSRASEEMFLAVSMAMYEGAVLQDGSGQVLAVNPAAENILGLAAAELVGRPSADFAQVLNFVNEDNTPFRGELHPTVLALQTGKPQRGVRVGARRPDGTPLWISISAQPLVSAGEPGPYAVVTTLCDITERLRNDRMLAQSEQKFISLAENMPGNLVRHDRQARVIYVNRALQATVASEELLPLGKSLIESRPGDDGAAITQRLIEGVIATGTPTEAEFQTPNIDGEMRIHQVRYVAERDGNGDIIGALGFGRDITENRQAEMHEQFRTQMLELLSGDASLQDILESITRGVELLRPGLICSILLADSEGKRFRKGIGPSLPDFYIAEVEVLEIGIGVGSCGTAAATGERVIVENVQTHPHWQPYKELAARAGLAACWSEPIHSSTGQVLGTLAIYHCEPSRPTTFDVSILEKSTHLASIAIERKRMEDEIRRREREFRTLVENSPDPIIRYDRDCRRLFVHTGNILRKGVSSKTLCGSTPDDERILAADEAKKLKTAIRQVFDDGAPVDVQIDFVDDYGSRRNHQMLLVPELDEKGEVATVLGLGRDITAIRDVERQMTQFVANLPGFAFTYQPIPKGYGRMPFVSPGVEKLFKLKPEDLKDDIAPLLAVAHSDDLPRIVAAIDESARTMAPFRVETRAARPGMTMRWGELRAVPVRQADGSVLWHGIMLDIDRRKRYEAELEQHRHHLEKLVEERTLALSMAKEAAETATRAKTDFLAAASHDLRQPLQAIRLFNDLLAVSGLNEQQAKIGGALSKAVGSLGELFDDLLDLSRLDAGTIEPRPAAIQADDLMGMIGAEFDAIFHQKKLRLNLFWPRQSLTLFSDGTLLQTILRNLISNAVKYTLRGGVLVAMRRRGDHALIQVWDTGIGIATEKMESVFEEYFQIGNPERDRTKGVGLGLAIVKRLSQLLGIEVHLRSREGRGSVFELSVPLAKELDALASTAQPAASFAGIASAGLPGKRIVLIDDDAIAAEAIKLSLEMDGAHVTLFGSAEDALISAKAMGADYYISDYRLPGMDGLELLNTIQEHTAEPIKAVVLTGTTAPAQVATMQSSRWKVLFKPVRIPQLLSALNVHDAAH